MTPIDWIVACEAAVANGVAFAAMAVGKKVAARAEHAIVLAKFWRSIAICVANNPRNRDRRPIPTMPGPRASAAAPETATPD